VRGRCGTTSHIWVATEVYTNVYIMVARWNQPLFLATQSLAAGALRGRGEEGNETRVKLIRQQGEGGAEVVDRGGSDDSGEFLAVLECDQRGPEFDAEGSAEASAGAVFNLDVCDVRELVVFLELGERGFDGGGGELAMSAPGGAEFEEQRAARGVGFFAGWAGGLVREGHGRN
jgi:hypothetical protein